MALSLARAAALAYLLALAYPAFAHDAPKPAVLADAALSDGGLASGMSAPGSFVRQSAPSGELA